MKLKKIFVIMLLAVAEKALAVVYYVSPTGTDAEATQKSSPGSLKAVISKLRPGDALYLLDGQYILNDRLQINKSGTADDMILVAAYEGAKPILDFRTEANKVNGVTVSGNYLHIRGLTIRYAGYKGIWLEKAKYCILEGLEVYGCCNAGIQLRSGGHNMVVNCDSHDNFDYQDNGGNADGFADKQGDACAGNVYIGCRSWNNSDDGWDSFQRVTEGTPTVYINCITYNNGPETYNLTEHPRVLGVDAGLSCFKGKDLKNFRNGGNPNGFKLGGKGTLHNTELYRCLAVGHRSKGFDQNNNAGQMKIVNCTAFDNNLNYGFGNDYAYSLDIHNCISLSPREGEKSHLKIHSSGTVTQSHNSWNEGFSSNNDDFESLDADGLILTPRNADGTLAETLLLHLKSSATGLIDKGIIYSPTNFEGEKIADYVIYKGSAPDLGCYEYDGSITGINGVSNDDTQLNSSAPRYDLRGRRVDNDYKGVVLQLGRKFLQH